MNKNLIILISYITISIFLIMIILILKRKEHVGKIYTTYDGITSGNKKIKKKRKVIVVDQSDDDLAISKLHENKENRIKYCIPNFIIKPDKHPALTKDTIVENKIIYGIKDSKNSNWRTIKINDLNKNPNGNPYNEPEDKLTNKELNIVKKNFKKETNKSKKKKLINKLWKKHKLENYV